MLTIYDNEIILQFCQRRVCHYYKDNDYDKLVTNCDYDKLVTNCDYDKLVTNCDYDKLVINCDYNTQKQNMFMLYWCRLLVSV